MEHLLSLPASSSRTVNKNYMSSDWPHFQEAGSREKPPQKRAAKRGRLCGTRGSAQGRLSTNHNTEDTILWKTFQERSLSAVPSEKPPKLAMRQSHRRTETPRQSHPPRSQPVTLDLRRPRTPGADDTVSARGPADATPPAPALYGGPRHSTFRSLAYVPLHLQTLVPLGLRTCEPLASTEGDV